MRQLQVAKCTMTPSRPECDIARAVKRLPALCGLLALTCCFPPNLSLAQPLDQSPGGIPGASGQDAPDGEPGVSSPGSMGMEEQGEPAFKAPVAVARKKFGERSKEYMCSLLDLGMYYNRHQRYADALKVLSASLTLADSGVLSKMAPKAVPNKKPAPPPQPVTSADGTVVSIDAGPGPPADVQFLQGILPALIEAETHQRLYGTAETHIKRLIAVCRAGGVADKVALMGAYSQYAELLRKVNRKAEAAKMQKQADDINSSFVGL